MALIYLIISIVILQILLLLLSPNYKNRSPFKWYYKWVFHPLFQDPALYSWKFYLVPIFYVGLYLYLIKGYYGNVRPLIVGNLFFIEDKLLVPICFSAPLLFGYASMFVKPYNSRSGHSKTYPFDELLYFPDISCSTCHVEKPARSKHCSICDCCVLLADHHCVWLNNCVGLGNYHHFYAFLISNTLALFYGFLRLIILIPHTKSRQLLTLTILCGAFASICGIFTYWQFKLVGDGMTTSEKDKWYTIQEFMREKRLMRTIQNKWYIKDDSEALTFYSTNAYDPKKYRFSPDHYSFILSPDGIPNMYDKGSFRANLRDQLEMDYW